jgi:hypothetical protein
VRKDVPVFARPPFELAIGEAGPGLQASELVDELGGRPRFIRIRDRALRRHKRNLAGRVLHIGLNALFDAN